jgi:hypothetical protein
MSFAQGLCKGRDDFTQAGKTADVIEFGQVQAAVFLLDSSDDVDRELGWTKDIIPVGREVHLFEEFLGRGRFGMGSMVVSGKGEELQVGIVRELGMAIGAENVIAWAPCEGESEEGEESDDESTHVRLLQMGTKKPGYLCGSTHC